MACFCCAIYIEQQSLLIRIQIGGEDAFRLDHFSVGAGPEHQILHFIVKDGVLLLRGIQRVDECKALVVFTAAAPNGLAVQNVLRRLGGRQAGRHYCVRADHRDVDREMMPAELNHPGRGCRRGSEERNVVLVESEANPAAASACRRGTCASLAATGPTAPGVLEDLISVHDVGDLLVALAAQGCGNERERRLALPRRHVAEAQAIALKDSRGKVGPAGPLAAREAERAFGPLGVGERHQELVGRLDHLRRYGSRRRGLNRWRRTSSLLGANSKRKHEREQNERWAKHRGGEGYRHGGPLASVHCHRRTSRWRLYQFPRAIENYSARTAYSTICCAVASSTTMRGSERRSAPELPILPLNPTSALLRTRW